MMHLRWPGRWGAEGKSSRPAVVCGGQAADRVTGGEARRRSIQAARRIMDNLRYAAAAGDLQGRREPLQRLRAFAGPLPGIYPTGS